VPSIGPLAHSAILTLAPVVSTPFPTVELGWSALLSALGSPVHRVRATVLTVGTGNLIKTQPVNLARVHQLSTIRANALLEPKKDYLLVGAAARSNSLFRVSREDPTEIIPVDFGDDAIWELNQGIDGLRTISNEGGVAEVAAAVYLLPSFQVQILQLRSEDEWATASVVGKFSNPTAGTFVTTTVTDDGDVWALSTDLSGVSGANIIKVIFEEV